VCQRQIAARIGASALTVIRAVDLNHEAQRGSKEVRNEAPEQWHLPAKHHAQTAATDLSP